jgi:hypothetical protein
MREQRRALLGEWTSMKRETRDTMRMSAEPEPRPRDWRPLFRRLRDALDWALDIAASLAGDAEEELESIANVREYVHAWLEGRDVEVDMTHILTTLAILFAAIDVDIEVTRTPLISPIRSFPPAFHLPGAKQAVVIRRSGYRNAYLSQVAA